MRIVRRVGSATLALGLVALPAGAHERLHDRLDRALRTGPEAPAQRTTGNGASELASLVRELEAQDLAQRREFDSAAARPLPPKARERLEAARRAWADGQGRLVGLLRGLGARGRDGDRDTARGRPQQERSPAHELADREEALSIVERMRHAARPEPLSAGGLGTVLPVLAAPRLLAAASQAAVDDLPVGVVAPEVRAQAESLSGPIAVYEWVRNTIRPELYDGVMKGPGQTLLESSGNDADTAGLLVALLRAKGIPARYVRGTVDLPAAAAVAITGTASPERALRALQRAGIPSEAVAGAGGLRAIRVERVWAEAYLPYGNYRGALLDAHEKAWVPLDPGYKRLSPPGGFDVRRAGFEAGAVFDEYLSSGATATPREYYRQRAETALAASGNGVTYDRALAARDVVPQTLGLLPASLPYAVVERAEAGYEPPDSLVHGARFVLESAGATVLDASFPTPELLGQRLTLAYVPAEESDEEVVRRYGGLFLTPPYLVEVKPVLRRGGVTIATGTAGVGFGVPMEFRVELTTPGGREVVTNRVLAGNLTAIGLAAGHVGASEGPKEEAAQILARLAFHYLDRWNRSDDELAALLRVVPIRPALSACFVQSAVEVDYAGGDPLYPVRYEWKGLAVDADRRPSAPVGIEDDEAEREFLMASGLEGSVLEHRVLEDDLKVPSVSTARALQLATAQGIGVLDLGPGDDATVLDPLPIDDGVKAQAREALEAGKRVRIPAGPVTLLAWSGVGYLILDPATGESGWQLQGGYSGGVTAPAVVALPRELVDKVWRQTETPVEGTGSAAFIQKFDTSDYQFGTVGAALGKPLKVLVTDENGYPVPGALVTFSAIGGGGVLVNPETGRAGGSEVSVYTCRGGEKVGSCHSLNPGEAVAVLQLGEHTNEVPRYVCEDPYTCTCPATGDCDPDVVGHATQVGMNLVSVRSGAAIVHEPFTAFALPERPPVPGVEGAFRVAVGLATPPQRNPVNLGVPDRLSLKVTDRFDNPVSNVPIRVAYRPLPVLGTPPAGGSLLRGATTTPGHVLRPHDYETCLSRAPSVIWGDCPGEAESVVTLSTSFGAFAYPVVGDSPWSLYYYDFGTTLEPSASWVAYHTDGLYCPNPSPSACFADGPQTLVWQGTRSVRTNLRGNLIEAYALGATAEVVAWADVLWEEGRVESSTDSSGAEHFGAVGTNQWHRERLFDSDIALRALTPGTTVPPFASPASGGRYAAPMTLGPLPQRNVVAISGRHFPPLVKYLNGVGGDVDPATVDRPSMTLRRFRDSVRPFTVDDTFSLWGIEPKLGELVPTPVLTDFAGTVRESSTVSRVVAPADFAALLGPEDVRFEVRKEADDDVVLAANGSGGDRFSIPVGLSLKSGRYYGQLSVLDVSAHAGNADVRSPALEIPVCSLLTVEKLKLKVDVVRDPLSGSTCGGGDTLRFALCRQARVSVQLRGEPFTASLDGQAVRALTDVVLAPGNHWVTVPGGLPELESDQEIPFTIEARDAEEPARVAVENGVVVSNVLNRSVLPVGRTFVKGVDLLDGHLVQQSTDFKVPGRHLGLELTRTYSSAGWGSQGPLGGGWSLSLDSRLYEEPTCGFVTVVTADGSSQVFRSTNGLLSFTPQKGYHTRLEHDGTIYRFIDKAGNVHRFEQVAPDGSRPIEQVEEPHGDRLVFSHDGNGRLTRVAEVQRGAGEVRAATFSYRAIYGYDRIVRAEVPALDIAVDYAYDDTGNLVQVTRDGRNLPAGGKDAAPRIERYRYLTPPSVAPPGSGVTPRPDTRRQHQLVEVVDPNGHSREFAYYGDEDRIPGEADGRVPGAGGLLFTERWELVREVVEKPAPGVALRTRFSYDATQAIALSEYRSTVRDARGKDTVYVLNGNGSPLRIEEPLGRTTTTTWSATDVLKTSETDANGRLTWFEYDERGNLTLERVVTSDLGPVETRYRYDARFNKLVYKQDAEGRETSYAIEPATGDLLATVDAVGDRTAYAYDDEGRLVSVTDPRGHATAHADHDSFGNAGRITDPVGNTTSRTFDWRGRLVRQTDSMGRDVQQAWDGLDRLVRTAKVAGSGSDDEVVETEYYQGGEPRLARNANGAETTYTLDGLSRVVATDTRFDGQTLTTATTWDANGNKETETERRGVMRRYTHDDLNRLVAVEIASGRPGEGPTGRIASYTYDLAGNRLSETNLAGLTTRFELDGLYRVTARVLPEANPSTSALYREAFRYDRVGNLLSQADANGHARSFEYDGLNRRTRSTNALGQAVTTTYLDPEGSRVNRAWEHDLTRGLRTTFAYDALNRETQRVIRLEGEGGGGAAYTTATAYDDPVHAVTVTDPRDVATRTRLDGLDRAVEVTVDPGGLGLVTRTSYDGLGNRKSVTDANGHTTTFRHDGLGRLVLTTDAGGRSTAAEYDGEGLETRETDRRGIARVFTYDNVGRPRTESLETPTLSGVPWRRETRYLDAARRRASVDARGHATTFDLDGLDRVVKETDALGAYRTFRWDGVNKREETDKRPAHHATLFEYDAIDRLTTTTDPAPFDSQTVVVTYDDAGNRALEKDRRGFVKRTQLDPLGRVVSVTRALGLPADEAVVETNAYDGDGNRVSQTDAEGRQTRFVYDAANRLRSRTDGYGSAEAAITEFKRDGVGNVVEERDARAALIGAPWSLTRTFDVLDRVETETNGEGNTTAYGYDAEGHRTTVTAPAGQVARFEYDERGALSRVVQPPTSAGEEAPATVYGYDENRNRVRQTDANGHAVAMEYDAVDRLRRRIQDPADTGNPSGLNLVTETQYDEDGRPVLELDPRGQATTSVYDELGRVRSKPMALAAGAVAPWRRTSELAYEYDATGNLARVTETSVDAAGAATDLVTDRTWDALDRLTAETTTLPEGGTRTIAYGYYRNGLRRTLTDATGLVTAYEYDGQNRLATATTGFGTPQAAATRYEYWPDDLLRTVTYPNGVTATHEYDRADRSLSITNARGATVVSSFQYFGTDASGQPVSYDPNGNRLIQVETNGGLTETTRYAYDGLDRLAGVTYPADASYPTGRVVTYGYDAVGNRVRETEHDGAATVLADRQGVFDNLNRLQTLTDTARPVDDPERLTTFEWDPNGNQVGKVVGSGPTAVATRYVYDTRDKLVEAQQGTGPGGSSTSILGRFQYDFEGRRIKKIGEEGLRQYVYDDTSLLAEYDASGSPKAKYDYGSDRLISLFRTDEGRRYFSLDGLRSVVNLTDDTGSTVASYHLDPWGNFRFPTELDSSKNRFAFTGHIFDNETGLYNAKARYFDPKLGRFLTQDSFLGQIDEPPSLHRYLYAANRPTFYVDPTGHSVLDLLPRWADAIPGVGAVKALELMGNQVSGPAGQNTVGEYANTTLGKLANAQSAFVASAVGATLQAPAKVVDSFADALTPGGVDYWTGTKADTSFAPARRAQIAALDAASDSSRSYVERGTFAALAVLSTPVTVAESLTTAPGGRAAEAVGASLQQAEASWERGDTLGAGLSVAQAGGEALASFSAYATLATPILPAPAPRSVWQEAARKRGNLIESRLARTEYSDWAHVGTQNRGYAELIDFQKSTNTVSLKSADTAAKSWKSSGMSRMRSHIRELGSGMTVGDQPANVVLDLRVPPGGSAAAEPLIGYGRQFGVTPIIREIDFSTEISRRLLAGTGGLAEQAIARH